MDSKFLYAAMMGDFDVISSFISNHSADDELLKLRVPNSGNTILHLASECGHKEAVNAILSRQSLLLLLFKVNNDGETALNLAAKGGHADVACALISFMKKLDIKSTQPSVFTSFSFIRFKLTGAPIPDFLYNKQVLRRWQDILQFKNMEGNTAIHEAIRYNRNQVVSVLLNENPGFKHSRNLLGETPLYIAASRGFDDLVDLLIKGCGSPICDGPCKRTALHGAVICNSKECTIKLLGWDKSLENRKDIYSQTPLHYAAQLGFVDLIKELLKVDASSAYITNGKGRNMLHIAAEHGQKDVIEFLIDECPLLVNNLITKKDNKGNTPLHLIAASNCFVSKLIHHRMPDKGDLNKEQLTPLDLAVYHNNGNSSTSAPENEVVEELKSACVIRFRITTPEDDFLNPDRLRKTIDNHMVVAALIATVAFTAGFAMPGGYIQSGSPNQGMAVLTRKSVSFQVFTISDVVALMCSTGALFMYFFSVLTEGKALRRCAVVGYGLNLCGLGAIIVAFIAGTHAVLQYSHALAIATTIVASCISFCVMVLFDFANLAFDK